VFSISIQKKRKNNKLKKEALEDELNIFLKLEEFNEKQKKKIS